MKKAIQYTGQNIEEIIDNFNINAEAVKLNIGTKHVIIGSSTHLMVKDWVIYEYDPETKDGIGYQIVKNWLVQIVKEALKND